MAEIKASSDEKVFRVHEFLGLNESPDGDTKLKLGEASVMRNFKITRDRSLQKRPGLDSVGSIVKDNVIQISSSSTAVRVDNNVSSALQLYPNASLVNDEIELSGDYVSVTYENWEDAKWFYWHGTDNNYYQLDRCEMSVDGDTTTYTWFMYLVSVVPAGDAVANVNGLWSGVVGGKRMVVGSVDDGIVLVWHENEGFVFRDIGTVNLFRGKVSDITFFGFSNRLYILTGNSYYYWDGEGDLTLVISHEAYAPLVAVSIPPNGSGGGATLQQINSISSIARAWLSPEGEADVLGELRFPLPGVTELSETFMDVRYLATGESVPSNSWYVDDDPETGMENIIVIADEAAKRGQNTIEVTYNIDNSVQSYNPFDSFGGVLPGMKYVEMYNGATDSRIFLYGDGTNRVYYSDFDENGVPRADYFPELNVINIGSENTPVTGLVRHYSRLIAFKEDEAYSIQYGTITLPDNTTTAAFYCTPINRNLGNEAMGQARLVLNSPYTLCGKDLYEWRNNSSYSSNLTIDERQAKRISDRVYATLATFDFSRCYCYDDKDHQEYYVCYDKKALVYNYAADAWYYYTNFDVTCMVNLNGELYAGDSLGRLNLVSRNNRTDNGAEITGYWASGAESFDREFMRKYSAMLWVVLKPELRSQVTVTVETDRKSDHSKKVAASSVFSFGSADFRRWSFNTNRKPHTTRLKIKAKKFTYYKLILEYSGTNTTATVVAADMRIRYTGYAK